MVGCGGGLDSFFSSRCFERGIEEGVGDHCHQACRCKPSRTCLRMIEAKFLFELLVPVHNHLALIAAASILMRYRGQFERNISARQSSAARRRATPPRPACTVHDHQASDAYGRRPLEHGRRKLHVSHLSALTPVSFSISSRSSMRARDRPVRTWYFGVCRFSHGKVSAVSAG